LCYCFFKCQNSVVKFLGGKLIACNQKENFVIPMLIKSKPQYEAEQVGIPTFVFNLKSFKFYIYCICTIFPISYLKPFLRCQSCKELENFGGARTLTLCDSGSGFEVSGFNPYVNTDRFLKMSQTAAVSYLY
jgi:hypothetical protein